MVELPKCFYHTSDVIILHDSFHYSKYFCFLGVFNHSGSDRCYVRGESQLRPLREPIQFLLSLFCRSMLNSPSSRRANLHLRRWVTSTAVLTRI